VLVHAAFVAVRVRAGSSRGAGAGSWWRTSRARCGGSPSSTAAGSVRSTPARECAAAPRRASKGIAADSRALRDSGALTQPGSPDPHKPSWHARADGQSCLLRRAVATEMTRGMWRGAASATLHLASHFHLYFRIASEGPMRARSLTIALALCAACSGGKSAKSTPAGDTLTERQRVFDPGPVAHPGRAASGRRCGRPIPRAPGFEPPTASPVRFSSPYPCYLLAVLAACGPGEPVRLIGDAPARALLRAIRRPLVVARGGHAHAAEMGDRFKLTDLILDTTRVAVGGRVIQGRLGIRGAPWLKPSPSLVRLPGAGPDLRLAGRLGRSPASVRREW